MNIDLHKVAYWNHRAVWLIEGDTSGAQFFRLLPAVLPKDATLFIEGIGLVRQARELYRKHAAKRRRLVTHDTVFPASYGYHVSPCASFYETMTRMMERFKCAQLFFHLKAYNSDDLLFWYHDACDNGSAIRLSKTFTEPNVKQLAAMLRCHYRTEKARTHDQFVASIRPWIKEAIRRDR